MATREVTAVNADLNLAIERMTEHDLLEVVELEEISGLSPWGWEAYHKELQSAEDVIMLVARHPLSLPGRNDGKSIVGFVVARLIGDELHVNNVAVRPEFRRHGIAARLLGAVLGWGRSKGSRLALLEVRAGNRAAQALYRRCGFRVTGRRRRYYQAPVEDALLMTVSLRSKPLI
jgi:ribosomal-protein-alanine N-acetyltransferase